MSSTDTVEQLTSLRVELDRATSLLVSPTHAALDEAAKLLEAATSQLHLVRQDLGSAVEPAARDAARGLQSAVRRTGRVLNAAANFFENWTRSVGAITGGYLPGGEPAPVLRKGRLVVHG